jgi:hypothetical protein
VTRERRADRGLRRLVGKVRRLGKLDASHIATAAALALMVPVLAASFVFIERPTAAESDSDGDGFTDTAEAFMGTDPDAPCNQTSNRNDEDVDAWPPDFNDDTTVDIADVIVIRSVYGSVTGDGTYNARYDLNTDGKIGIADVVGMRSVYGEGCVPIGSVEQWSRFETSVANTGSYSNPYYDVTLDATYTRPDGSVVDFWGFYDGGTTWKIRFICDQPGAWSYSASFSDGSPGVSGRFDCVASTIPGMLAADETNPMWFGFKGGQHILVRSFHVGDRFFASNWDDPADPNDGNKRTVFLDWAQQQGYNTLSIASHYLNRDKTGRGQGWNTPDLWDSNAGRPNAAEYGALEEMLDDLADRRILVYPFAGFFGKNSDRPTNSALQTQYIRYTVARLGAYWNVMLNVAGPELGGWSTGTMDQLGQEIAALDMFDHPLSVHNFTGDDPFKNSSWSSYVTLQGPKTNNQSTLSSGLLKNHHPSKPLYAQETLWPGNNNHPNYNDTNIRKNAYVITMSAAALNFADMDGNSSSGFSGSMNLSQRNQAWHDIVKDVWDFFETVPFYRMSPCQNLVNNGYCLAEVGNEYLIYLDSGGTVDVSIQGGTYDVEWINAQDTSDRRSGGTTGNGDNLTSPSDGDDWLLQLH